MHGISEKLRKYNHENYPFERSKEENELKIISEIIKKFKSLKEERIIELPETRNKAQFFDEMHQLITNPLKYTTKIYHHYPNPQETNDNNIEKNSVKTNNNPSESPNKPMAIEKSSI